MPALPYENEVFYPQNTSSYLFSRILFFNKAFMLWRFKAFDWLDLEFSIAPSMRRDIITKYKRIT